MTILRSLTAGVASFAVAAFLAILLADAVLVVGDRTASRIPESLAVRNTLAAAATVLIIVVAAGVAFAIPRVLRDRLQLNVYAAFAAAAVLGGAALHPFLMLMTVANSCGLGTHWPYASYNACE